MTIAWHVVGYGIGYGMGCLWEAMKGHERPYGLVPKTWD